MEGFDIQLLMYFNKISIFFCIFLNLLFNVFLFGYKGIQALSLPWIRPNFNYPSCIFFLLSLHYSILISLSLSQIGSIRSQLSMKQTEVQPTISLHYHRLYIKQLAKQKPTKTFSSKQHYGIITGHRWADSVLNQSLCVSYKFLVLKMSIRRRDLIVIIEILKEPKSHNCDTRETEIAQLKSKEQKPYNHDTWKCN